MTDMNVSTIELEEVGANKVSEKLFNTEKFNLVADVQVELTVELGGAQLTVQELFDIKKNSVLRLNESIDADLLVKLNGHIVATGKLVAVDDNFGVQITHVNS